MAAIMKLSSGMLRRAVLKKLTKVSEVLTASVIRAVTEAISSRLLG
jgi:hypothetical protein